MNEVLSETALAFAREILGWPDARQHTGTDAIFHGHGGGHFKPADLNPVMSAVRAWVDTMPGWYLQIHSIDGTEKGWAVMVCGPDDDGVARGEDLCECLMSACLQANTKIDGVKDD